MSAAHAGRDGIPASVQLSPGRELSAFQPPWNEIMKETAKALGLSEAATLKMEEFYKKTYETMKEKGECPDDKTDEEKKKFMEESIAAIQADVDEADRELVAKVVAVSYEAIQKKKAEIAAADQ